MKVFDRERAQKNLLSERDFPTHLGSEPSGGDAKKIVERNFYI